MGNASENCVEQSADGGNCEEKWQSHAEKPTGTHAVLFLVDLLDLFVLFIGGGFRQAEGLTTSELVDVSRAEEKRG